MRKQRKPKTGLQATSLRKAMITLVVILIILASVGFYFGQDWLTKYAAEVDQTTSGSSASSSSSQALSQLHEEITNNQPIGAKASALVASSQNYQNKIISDLNKYASSTGISIAGYNLTQPTITGDDAGATISGVKSKFVTITLNNPIPIRSLLQFFKAIESNLPKMQITGISISSSSTKDNVTVDPLTIEVYTK
ncbi:hypothetical protein COV88_02520 [Candidatus Saccharibacteria bacterium CG11_big_fil_rev_8_21_14_0_20_41_19]|nr:hypothetical protein [Candidatus Saccharibacteria bacterium]OIP86041.1 MAG: hypothetical protein AUK57_01875 [Candidatus Saccharibacteria bacterium CG2_30_41_52]PIQ70768.1 MAG: hypothetical protein COV88_02520 [Candidatus Saccharibacteria bacterium CG11_big_fil_rev_8_21_14_0_20_41_19]PIZ59248.1 MAG: hypothetical protein COY18_03925 [Candidatus Saccharibacteria bacterium CG_4_10_14_0_2_um_filter_41_11]PJC30039.1 MAG: hypothetical protein CO052_00255 [Candidatus Saccharibacteria bacterium CG_4